MYWKRALFLILTILVTSLGLISIVKAETTVKDSFEDGDYTTNPVWTEELRVERYLKEHPDAESPDYSLKVVDSIAIKGDHSLKAYVPSEGIIRLTNTELDPKKLEDGTEFSMWIRGAGKTLDLASFRLISTSGSFGMALISIRSEEVTYQGGKVTRKTLVGSDYPLKSSVWYKLVIVWHNNSLDFRVENENGQVLASKNNVDTSTGYDFERVKIVTYNLKGSNDTTVFFDDVSYRPAGDGVCTDLECRRGDRRDCNPSECAGRIVPGTQITGSTKEKIKNIFKSDGEVANKKNILLSHNFKSSKTTVTTLESFGQYRIIVTYVHSGGEDLKLQAKVDSGAGEVSDVSISGGNPKEINRAWKRKKFFGKVRKYSLYIGIGAGVLIGITLLARYLITNQEKIAKSYIKDKTGAKKVKVEMMEKSGDIFRYLIRTRKGYFAVAVDSQGGVRKYRPVEDRAYGKKILKSSYEIEDW